MFIPIPLSFTNPNTARTLNIVLIVVGIVVITLLSMWLTGILLIGFSIYNLYVMNKNSSSFNTRNRSSDKDGFV